MPAAGTTFAYTHIYNGAATNAFYNTDANSWGIFGKINKSTTFAQVRDGLSNTIMTGEMQRIIMTVTPYGPSSGPICSSDGWAIGGQATTFSTGVAFKHGDTACHVCTMTSATPYGKQMNNGYFVSPGSEHSGGANFGMADGSRAIHQRHDRRQHFRVDGQHGRRRAGRLPEQVAARPRTANMAFSRRQLLTAAFFCARFSSSPRWGRHLVCPICGIFLANRNVCRHRC